MTTRLFILNFMSLPEGYIDVSIHVFIAISSNTEVKKSSFLFKSFQNKE